MRNFDEVYETLPGNGWLSRGEAELLWRSMLLIEGPVLEVGCYEGRSTVLLASFGHTVYCVDPFAGFDDADPLGAKTWLAWSDNMNSRGICHALLFRQKIEDWEPRPVEFAYLDGEHTYDGTIIQIEKALACSPKRIAIHDVNDDGQGALIKRAAIELLGPWVERVERLAVWDLK